MKPALQSAGEKLNAGKTTPTKSHDAAGTDTSR